MRAPGDIRQQACGMPQTGHCGCVIDEQRCNPAMKVLALSGKPALMIALGASRFDQRVERLYGGRQLLVKQPLAQPPGGYRSEEHTSELQSLMRISYAVFSLKKKNTHRYIHDLSV